MDPAVERLLGTFESRGAIVAVVGLGYVGLPLLDAVVRAGFSAIGLDSDAAKIEMLTRGESYLPHLPVDIASGLNNNDRVVLTSDRGGLVCADAVILCVPTPLDDARAPDLGAVERAAADVGRHAVKPQPGRARLVVLESSTYPGTTREVVKPAVLGAAGLDAASAPETLLFAYSPEREDPGNAQHTTRTIPKLVGGLDEVSGAAAAALYGAIVETVVPCKSAEVAEAAKLVENVYRSVNIALVNELKTTLDAMGLDVRDVLDAAGTKPFGFHRFEPGPGFGGHCVPIDPYYLAWRAERAGARSRFVELAGDINRAMPTWVVERTVAALAGEGVGVEGARVLILGVAYKKNVADIRESPAFEIIELLRERGCDVTYHDPHVARTHRGRRRDYELASEAWSEELVRSADAVVVVTDHDWYDWDVVAQHARLVVDTRGVMRGRTSAARVVPA